MATEFKLPELGENIESADVVSVLVKAGDTVEKDQGLIEIETDKATVEVPADKQGKIKEVLVNAGDKIKVGQTIAVIEEGENGKEKEEKVSAEKTEPEVKEEKSGEEKKKEPEKKKEEPKEEKKKEEAALKAEQSEASAEITDIKLPELGENIDTADVVSVLVKEGDKIEKDQGILEIETDKATVEVPSPINGEVTEVLIKQGDKAKTGQTLIRVRQSGVVKEKKEEVKKDKEPEPEERKEKKPSDTKVQEKISAEAKGEKESFSPGEIDHQPPITKGSAPAAPSVRRLARELGIDINNVPGTGPAGRISMDDVKAFVKKRNEEGFTPSGEPTLGIKKKSLPDFSKWGEVETKPMSKIRSVTADHLSYAWVSIPHVTQHDKADITELEKVRKKLNPEVEKAGAKLTVTAILVKIAVAGLKKFPQFNSSIDMEKHEVIYKKYFNIGIAVDTEFGLIVPVIKNADRKSITEISLELNELAEKARTKKASLDELQGACFTITNLGGIGGTYFTPIVNSPEVAILGVSIGSYEPVYKDGDFVPRLMLPLSLSYDHRIIDGADAARFLRWVCEVLEEPVKLFL
jgi:pyruvate dehydrogenase E2 component (dihydrolipoamide acetyltransferase)